MELREYLYGGFIAELEYGWKFEELADSISISNGKDDILYVKTTLDRMWRSVSFPPNIDMVEMTAEKMWRLGYTYYT